MIIQIHLWKLIVWCPWSKTLLTLCKYCINKNEINFIYNAILAVMPDFKIVVPKVKYPTKWLQRPVWYIYKKYATSSRNTLSSK